LHASEKAANQAKCTTLSVIFDCPNVFMGPYPLTAPRAPGSKRAASRRTAPEVRPIRFVVRPRLTVYAMVAKGFKSFTAARNPIFGVASAQNLSYLERAATDRTYRLSSQLFCEIQYTSIRGFTNRKVTWWQSRTIH
jgi:hypothetical protein